MESARSGARAEEARRAELSDEGEGDGEEMVCAEEDDDEVWGEGDEMWPNWEEWEPEEADIEEERMQWREQMGVEGYERGERTGDG